MIWYLDFFNEYLANDNQLYLDVQRRVAVQSSFIDICRSISLDYVTSDHDVFRLNK